MKSIINGRVYCTDTAMRIASCSNGGDWRDFSHYEETLYRKRTGEYFLYGAGGAASRYAQRADLNGWSNGSRIIPLTAAAAREWAEQNMNTNEYDAEFGTVPEDNSRTVVSWSLRADLVELIRRMASEQGVSQSALIDSILSAALNERPLSMADVADGIYLDEKGGEKR